LKNGEYEIVDFKTGKPHDYINTDFQLGLYSLVAKEYFALPIKRAVICYVEHEIETEYKIDAGLLLHVKEKYDNTVTAIREQQFDATPGSVCVRCEYRKMCPYKQ
jgi:CRISPR/Cas system-associated exonuclease Cas4 (RecB family)